ncbi:hypothetical protein BIV25_34000 [Streptomyces sp. MUSC 14]|uniref:SAM-dependent methyltransferase n=1 Tax=Streptomyces sp. MUSC 14 TaxID=1354889 RepID=UPI0008F588D2|nr:class I SAM-dependent methyltransferase [Streptomyces sp. MUSC 14]OIJ89467.1 hypothetical protein BIV25_34000 [Streptomyces sp. MUSC 14]
MLSASEFTRVLEDPSLRRERYAAMLPAFYTHATDAYRGHWADSFHLPPFQEGQSLSEALTAQERRLARVAGLRAGMRALDVGCGVGGPALTIAGYSGAHVTGINIVPWQLETAEKRAAAQGLRNLTGFLNADMMALPFEDGTFDVAFSFDAICHAPDKDTVYAEIARVLKPGGVFVGADWLCADGLTGPEYQEWIEPVCVSSALPDVLSLCQMVSGLTRAGFLIDDYCDLAAHGDMGPNWQIFEQAAATLTEPRPAGKELMYQHCLSTARAGRAGKFIIGYWSARKPTD